MPLLAEVTTFHIDIDVEAEKVLMTYREWGEGQSNLIHFDTTIYVFDDGVTEIEQGHFFFYNRKQRAWWHKIVMVRKMHYWVANDRLMVRKSERLGTKPMTHLYWMAHIRIQDDVLGRYVRQLCANGGLVLSDDEFVGQKACYPLLRQLPYDRLDYIQFEHEVGIVRQVIGKRDLPTAAKFLCGAKATRAHQKALANVLKTVDDPHEVMNAVDLIRGLVPTDYLAEMMRQQFRLRNRMMTPNERKQIRSFLKLFRPQRIMDFMRDDTASYFLVDTARQYYRMLEDGMEFPIYRYRNLRDLHDAITLEARRFQAQWQLDAEAREIDQAWYHDVDGLVAGDIIIVTPKQAKDLIYWGVEMNHCIGSYTTDAAKGISQFLAFMKNGKMYGNMQITGGRVNQVFGKSNRLLPEGELVEICSKLFGAGLLKDVHVPSYMMMINPNEEEF